ncbi:glycerate kinase [Chitinimonas sp. BJB300]|uniref:glycerate kinase n=1 Tax=Chitinimonas sp. BJB300 TaxID=1559339 RepID=UPI000C110442|nr:glycerate kinase [Chitinimonas sp. BJB300]PHV10996.1 glycerate kinase [Chitinimonas sp. BJB300]TSJ87552.1 glycerate kinase [Chitinimonas sp. BJB300]
MQIVIAPDSFKGSLSATEVAAAMASGVRKVWPDADIRLHPMADGGEGTLAAIAAVLPVDWLSEEVTNLADQPISAKWLRLADNTAELESAEVVGLHAVGDSRVEHRHSLGLGRLVKAALDAGYSRILVGLGGTGSNDGGVGLLVALGAKILDVRGALLPPTPAGLMGLHQLDLGGLDPRLKHTELIGLADVASPLAGPEGATAVFGPQKGVAADQVAVLDACLANLGVLGDAQLDVDYRLQAGSGTAGGLGWAIRLLGGRLEPGAETIARLQGLEASLVGANYVLTGEGCSDMQTLLGKVPWRVAGYAAERRVPAVLLSGGIEPTALPALQGRFAACLSLTGPTVSVAEATQFAARLLTERTAEWARACDL